MNELPSQYQHSAQIANYARFPVEFVRGEGMYLYDAEGTAYLDMLSGLGVNSLGHCHPQVVEAIQRQAKTLLHSSNLYWTPQAERLAGRLVEMSFADKAFFCNSGAEAVEAAIKLARAHAYNAGSAARKIVVVERAFHGRTMGALSATPQEDKQAPFAPLVSGFQTVARDDAQALTLAVDEQTCAVLLEPIQGEGGVHVFSDEFLVAAREACDRVGALLIFDEVQCGIGRTGKMFAHQHTPVEPDVLTLAKALAGGLPIGAVLAAEHCSAALKPGFHGSTFGGNPVSCAAANAVLDVIESEDLLQNATVRGAQLATALVPLGQVQGRGLMQGVTLTNRTDAREIVNKMLTEHHTLINATDDSTLRFLPPLLATPQHIDVASTGLRHALT
ncbi:MAG: aspartate aminotransferase family protein [Thermoleophilaceae bacterium]|nr:aspartate aminotransferase family protein [Thermoleophilaceae bacterium]